MRLWLTTLLVAILVVLSASETQAPALAQPITWKPTRAIETQFAKAYALRQFPTRQAKCAMALWTKESGFRYWASNPQSSAYGIAQVLNTPKHLTPYEQIDRGVKYINHRYGSINGACRAWSHWLKRGWY